MASLPGCITTPSVATLPPPLLFRYEGMGVVSKNVPVRTSGFVLYHGLRKIAAKKEKHSGSALATWRRGMLINVSSLRQIPSVAVAIAEPRPPRPWSGTKKENVLNHPLSRGEASLFCSNNKRKNIISVAEARKKHKRSSCGGSSEKKQAFQFRCRSMKKNIQVVEVPETEKYSTMPTINKSLNIIANYANKV